MISSFGTYFASNALCIPCFVVCMPCCFVSVHNVFLKYWGTDTRAVAHLKLCGDRPPSPPMSPPAGRSQRPRGWLRLGRLLCLDLPDDDVLVGSFNRRRRRGSRRRWRKSRELAVC